MRKILFLMTHDQSNWQAYSSLLMQDSRIEIFCTESEYHHPDDLKRLTDLPHKKNDAKAIWGEVLTRNEQLTDPRLGHFYIYIDNGGNDPVYRWRIAGMRQYYKKTGGLWNPDLELDTILNSLFG